MAPSGSPGTPVGGAERPGPGARRSRRRVRGRPGHDCVRPLGGVRVAARGTAPGTGRCHSMHGVRNGVGFPTERTRPFRDPRERVSPGARRHPSRLPTASAIPPGAIRRRTAAPVFDSERRVDTPWPTSAPTPRRSPRDLELTRGNTTGPRPSAPAGSIVARRPSSRSAGPNPMDRRPWVRAGGPRPVERGAVRRGVPRRPRPGRREIDDEPLAKRLADPRERAVDPNDREPTARRSNARCSVLVVLWRWRMQQYTAPMTPTGRGSNGGAT